MNRLDESESTPKKRNPKQQQQLEAIAKDAVTKSGRKVKRPAHLDSPDRVVSASPSSEPRKSVAVRAQTASEPGHATTPVKRATTKGQSISATEEVRGSRKTIAEIKTTNSGKVDTPKGKTAKESIVDDGVGISKSGRKIKIPAKLAEFDSDVLSSPSRKNAVPEHDEPVKDKPTKTPGRTKTPAKSAMKNITLEDDVEEGGNKVSRKTPGRRAKSVAPSGEPEQETVSTTRRRGVTSLFSTEAPPAEPTHPSTPGKRMEKSLLNAATANILPKTPGRRAKSMAPPRDATCETESKTSKKTAQTPGRRAGKSIANPPSESSKSPRSESPVPEKETVQKTPGRRAGKSMLQAATVAESPTAQRAAAKTPDRRRLLKYSAEDNIESAESTAAEEVISRSGRKIKPKKVFDFEQDEKTTEQTADNSRKRKAESTEDSSLDTMMSPMKRKAMTTRDDTEQTPKLKGRLVAQTDSNASVDGSVSRSGRKIKPKKMYGFEDGESAPGSSPTADEESAARKSARSTLATKAKTVSTPSKARVTSSAELMAESRPMEIDQQTEDSVDEPHTFITKRGVNDHHPSKYQHMHDETDHAEVSSEPVIIRTSIGFGKPKVQKQAPPEQRVEDDDDSSRHDAQLVGNSADVTSSPGGRPSVAAINEKQGVLSSPKQQADKKQEPEESRATNSSVNNTVANEVMGTDEEGVYIPEGPVKVLVDESEPSAKDSTEADKQETLEQEEFNTEKSDSNDVEMEPEKALLDVGDEDEEKKEVNNDETMTKEESSDTLLVAEMSEEVPEKQQTDLEETESSEDKTKPLNSIALPDVANSDGFKTSVKQEASDKCSPANQPEVIEIMDNSVVEAFCKQINDDPAHDGADGGCATSTPQAVRSALLQHQNQNEGRKRSFSASAADTEQNVTLQSPAKSNVHHHSTSPSVAAAAPCTPDPKLPLEKQEASNKCSPATQPEVIEIMDSPAVAAFCQQINDEAAHGADGGSAISTSLTVQPSLLQHQQQNEGRKRSLSASAADTTIKRNVTFHSPANSTMLVETIDERLMLKSLHDQQQQHQDTLESSCSKGIGEKLHKIRKRSLSEHKPSEMKRNKVSKLPNFKSIHANHFNRMESLADFMNRKESRAKQLLSSCSPATKLLSNSNSVTADAAEKSSAAVSSMMKKAPPSTTKPFVFKSTGGGGIPVTLSGAAAALFVKRTKEAKLAVGPGEQPQQAASEAKKPIPNPNSVTTGAAENSSAAVTSMMKKVPQSTTKPFVFKSAGGGGIPVASSGAAAALFVKRTKEAPTAAKSAAGLGEHHHHQELSTTATAAASIAKKPIPSDTERMANRLKQFHSTFKPKKIGTGTADKTTAADASQPAVDERPVEQLRSKQSQILKGVRTNRRFELQMKHRDNVQHQ
ncbi:microtubule-associated protein futsch-like isoform X1 [Anopheles stephensi]|uniref:microtubule-associated protein futsch-like isoform X1 n=1 Tax=Anopheles stephensi TaxID=30069 RepID=UPI001658946F|nr:microtubule-associated protein futsch-like isoform X1 [Anopheles stephensi]XP_035903038.1 microtubule-associated protein futsch-like isoform X1 [Anopheles stephensi]